MANTQPILDRVLDYVEVSSWALKAATDEVEGGRQAQAKAAALRGPLIDKLVANGILTNTKEARDRAELVLGGHDTTLMVMSDLVEKLAEATAKKPAAALGEPVNDPAVKTASAIEPSRRFIGEPTMEVRESDRSLMALIGR